MIRISKLKRKLKSSKLLLIVAILTMTIGFAYLSSTLNINGIGILKGNRYDIHWDDTSIKTTEGSVTPLRAANVIDADKKNVDFSVEFELPGDYYEFTVDAVNAGTLPGVVKAVNTHFYKEDGVTETTLPSYLSYSFTHTDGSEVAEGELLPAGGGRQNYKVNLKFKETETELPEDPKPTDVKIEIIIDPVPTDTYVVEFNPNSGSVTPNAITVEKGNAVGELPTPVNGTSLFDGWYTEIDGGTKIKSTYVPTSSITLYAHWVDNYSIFDTGSNVNIKLKALAGNSNASTYQADENITSITKSTTQPNISTMTDANIVSVAGNPIYAWYDNGTIYWWSESESNYLNQNAASMFASLKNATSLDTSFKTSNTTNMMSMFEGCVSLASLDLSEFDTSNVTDIGYMFRGTKIAELDLSNFDTSSVTSMQSMFFASEISDLNLSNFDTSNVTAMYSMFYNSNIPIDIDLSHFDTSNVTSMESMFRNSTFTNINLSGWNTSKVTDMGSMFEDSKVQKLDLSSFDVSKLSSFGTMLRRASELKKLDISNWKFKNTKYLTHAFSEGLTSLETIKADNVDTSKITDMDYMFANLPALKSIDLTSFDTSSLLYMNNMFDGDSSLKTLDLSSFDTRYVSNMASMLKGCTSLETLNLSNWKFANYNPGSLMSNLSNGGLPALKTLTMDNVSLPANMNYGLGGLGNVEELSLNNVNSKNVTDMTSMFVGDIKLKSLDLSSFNTKNVTNMSSMFAGDNKLESIDLSSFNTKNVTNMSNMFAACSSLKSLDLSSFNTSNVTNMSNMFGGASKLNTLDLSSFNTKKVTDMSNMFAGCTNIGRLELSSFITNNVTNMSYMFSYAKNLSLLDLTLFNTSNVKNMSYMFNGMSSLTTIVVGDNFVVNQVTNSTNMFSNSVNIVGGYGTEYDSNHVDSEYAHYDYNDANPGYFNKAELDLDIISVTFNANGGVVSPTTKSLVSGSIIGSLPTPTNGELEFKGWYTDIKDGIKIDENYIPVDGQEFWAHWVWEDDITINYDSNGGTYGVGEDNVNSINYTKATSSEVKYSHTPNVGDDGVAATGYATGLEINDVVTIDGAKSLRIELWYSTRYSYDWLAIYPAGVTPNSSNYSSATISKSIPGNSDGKLYGYRTYGYSKPSDTDTQYHQIITVDGNTAQFYFKSSWSNGYGYYAIVTKADKYDYDKEYKEPTKENYRFNNWNTKADGTGISYSSEKEILNDIDNISGTVYAQWHEEYTITFNTNGGTLDENAKKVLKGDEIGELPLPTYPGYAFVGWYTEISGGTRIDKTYIPESSLTLWAHWTEIEAEFDTGKNVSAKLKALAGDTDTNGVTYSTTDNNITAIRKATTAPNISSMTDDNVVSSSSSRVPIYAWYDDGTIYYWSEANKLHLNMDASYMFYNFRNVETIDTDFETSNTFNMEFMFDLDTSLTKLDLSSFDTSNVTNMQHMFDGCKSLVSLDLSNFNTSNVTNFNGAFYDCNGLKYLNISNWDFSKVNSFIVFSHNTAELQQLETFILDNVIFPSDMTLAFSYLSSLKNLSLKNVDSTKVTNMYEMFYETKNIVDIDMSDFDTSNVTNMQYLFYNCKSLKNLDISTWNTSKVTDMGSMFWHAESIEKLDLSHFDTSNVANMYYLLGDMYSLTELNLSNWDFRKYNKDKMMIWLSDWEFKSLKKLTMDNATFSSNMYGFFAEMKTVEEISLKNVDTSRVTTMYYMFDSCNNLKTLDLRDFDTSNVTTLSYAFSNCYNLKFVDTSTFNTSNVTTFYDMFYNCYSLEKFDGSNFDTDNVTNFYGMFESCNNLKYLNVSNFNFSKYNTSNLMSYMARNANSIEVLIMDNATFGTSMFSAFKDLPSLQYISLSNVDTSNTTDMGYLFANTSNLKSLDLGSFDTSKVTNMSNMFASMLNLKSIYVSDDFGVNKVTASDNMFYNCYSLVGGAGSAWNPNHIDKEYAHYDHGTHDPGYFDKSSLLCLVTFDANGGQLQPNELKVKEENVIGTLPTPTRKNYIFQGWYIGGLTDGIKINAAYIVREDLTITARWTPSVDLVVTFNANGGEVSETSRTVAGGEEIGELPIPTNGDNIFKGWYTEIDNGLRIDMNYIVNEEQTMYAHWDTCHGFATDSWATIRNNINRNSSYYPVGCTKNIDMGDYGTHTVRIANNTKPVECYRSDFSQSACGFVLEFADIITAHRMNPYENIQSLTRQSKGQGNIGGWEYSEARKFINNDIYESLPTDLQNMIINTSVVSGYGFYDISPWTTNESELIHKTTDKLYLLSVSEIYSSTGVDNITSWVIPERKKGRQLDYYNIMGTPTFPYNYNKGETANIIKKNYSIEDETTDKAAGWYLRSIRLKRLNDGRYDGDIQSFYIIDSSNSNLTVIGSYYDIGISPAFRIG